jgi:TetR/AcrR family transcriptional regulator, mexJK operon transcriptional repressor
LAAPETLSREKREAILDGAARIFAARGYEGASMSAITTAAAVSKGTIYQHFPGKAALFAATVARECDRKLAHLFHDLGTTEDVAATLQDIGTRFVAMLTSDVARAIERIVVSEADRFPELAVAFFDAGPARAIATMAHYLSAQTASGRLAVPDPAFAAEQFLTMCQTRVVMRAKLHMPVAANEAPRVVAAAVQMFLAVYGVP